jgi:hypothetical protein
MLQPEIHSDHLAGPRQALELDFGLEADEVAPRGIPSQGRQVRYRHEFPRAVFLDRRQGLGEHDAAELG